MENTFNFIREVSCRVTNSVIKYIESIGYNTDSIIEGLPYAYEHLTDPFNWVTNAARETICQRTAKLLSNEAIMFQVGLATPKLNPLGGIEHILRLLGSPKLVYRAIPKYVAFFDKTFKFKITLTNNNKATVSMSLPDDYELSKHSCYYAKGILAAIPTLWGLPPAEVHEKQCMCQLGDRAGLEGTKYRAKACIYEVTWQQTQPWHSKPLKNIFRQSPKFSTITRELENNYQLLDKKNSELLQKNRQLAKIRELALAVHSVGTLADVWSIIVELAKDIPGVKFVLIHQPDPSGNNIITPYYSKIDNPSIIKMLKAVGFDPDIHFGKTATSRKWTFPVAKSHLAQDIIANPRTIVLEGLYELADGILSKPTCHTIQKILGFKKIALLPILPGSPNQSVIIFFIDDDVPIDILEMVGAHCAAAVKNVSTLTILAERNQELKESEEYAKTLSNSLGLGVFVVDTETHKIVDANPAAIKQTGFGEDQVLGHICHDFVCPAEKEKCPVLDLGQTVDFSERVLLTASSERLPILKSVVPITRHGHKYLLESFADISLQKKMEAELSEQKALIDRILLTTPNAVLVIDKDLKVILANRTFYDTFQVSSSQVDGKHLGDILNIVALCEAISKVLTGEHSRQRVEFKLNVTTQVITMAAEIIAMKEKEEVLVIISDITEERERLEKLYLADRLVSVGEMASGIAHELNNPLTGVIGFSELLIESKLPQDIAEEVAIINNEAKRAATVVKNLLTFARKHTPMRQLCQINSIIEDIMQLRDYEHKVNNIRVDARLNPKLPEIMVDYYQVQQAFLNIVLNAESAMIEANNGGTLTITTEIDNKSVRITFADDGPGIPELNLKRIFDPFFSTKEVGKGTGLGLSICHGIVASHNGKIYAKNEQGKGATFVVELPTVTH